MTTTAIYGATHIIFAISAWFFLAGDEKNSFCEVNMKKHVIWGYFVGIVVCAAAGFTAQGIHSSDDDKYSPVAREDFQRV